MTLESKAAVLLILISISAVSGLTLGQFPGQFPDSRFVRRCRKVEVSSPNADPIFYPVPEPFERKYYFIPFTIITSKVIAIMISRKLT